MKYILRHLRNYKDGFFKCTGSFLSTCKIVQRCNVVCGPISIHVIHFIFCKSITIQSVHFGYTFWQRKEAIVLRNSHCQDFVYYCHFIEFSVVYMIMGKDDTLTKKIIAMFLKNVWILNLILQSKSEYILFRPYFRINPLSPREIGALNFNLRHLKMEEQILLNKYIFAVNSLCSHLREK